MEKKEDVKNTSVRANSGEVSVWERILKKIYVFVSYYVSGFARNWFFNVKLEVLGEYL